MPILSVNGRLEDWIDSVVLLGLERIAPLNTAKVQLPASWEFGTSSGRGSRIDSWWNYPL